jgi:hypothetical protein
MGFNALLSDGLGNAFRITSLELTRQKIAKPAFKKWYDATHEEKPDAPTGSPETDTRTLTNGTSIEAIIDEMLQVLCHSNLPHELVLVTVHACKGPNMRKNILKSIRELERVDVAKTVLDMRINDELRQAKNFSTQVESIPKARLLPLFCGQGSTTNHQYRKLPKNGKYGLYRFQVHVVVEVQIVQVLKAPSQRVFDEAYSKDKPSCG